jgi:inhibitor of cysteine peptidase
MTLTGWIIVSLLSVVVLVFGYRFISDILWNTKLGKFHKTNHVVVPKVSGLYWLKRSYGLVLSSLLVVATVSTGAFSIPITMGERVLVNAAPVQSLSNLMQIIEDANASPWWNDFFRGDIAIDAIEPEMEASGDYSGSTPRDYIGTNTQIEGVDEADIVKTDGYTIYYASRYQNKIRVIDILDDHTAELQADLDLGNLYTDALYLTETQLIVIGYIYTVIPYEYIEGSDYFGWAYISYTGAVRVYDRETMELEYTLETDSNFYEHRLIGNSLFLISSKSIHTDELRPVFKETEGEEDTVTNYLPYEDIYYFDDMPIYSMTVVTGIQLETYEVTSQAFLGGVSEIFASEDSIYTVNSYYTYTLLNEYRNFSQIVKYDLDTEHASITYVGEARVEGYVGDQYWMDEFNGYFRVVTSTWWPTHNALYILEEDEETDVLNVVGSITEGLGKENEQVKSVRFIGNTGYVVTFEQTDPLYRIDLSDPTAPVIVSAIEEPGYSTYMHIWDEEAGYVVGFGFSADTNGRVNGLKISAYDTSDPSITEPLESYQLNAEDEEGIYSYSYSEASYNPKALMVSPTHGIIAFPVMSFRYFYDSEKGDYEYSYVSQFMVFYIDFTAEQIISDPIIINHEETYYYAGIDRGVYINGHIYTLSYTEMKIFDLMNQVVLEDAGLKFDVDQELYYGIAYID